ncbi:MAG: hypothetical protein M3R27_08820 [Bacteroidota bacterium]|nr:hypothetical protein [Bacteroidota bacterium]
MPQNIKSKSVVKCPICKYKKEVIMPVMLFQTMYECEECNARLKPNVGDCCVFCSFGSVPCPPVQKEKVKS